MAGNNRPACLVFQTLGYRVLNYHCFVAHIDILGFRAMVGKDPEHASRALSDLADVRELLGKIYLSFIETAEERMLAENIFSVMFSDTIVLFTKSDTNRDLQAIIIATSEVLHKAMFNYVPVRAGLAHGLFFYNVEKSMYSGPALIDAYDISECAQWLGVVTTEAIWRKAVAAKIKSGDNDIVIPAKVPTKNGPISAYALNWPAIYRHDFKIKPPIPTELFYSQFEHAFGPFASLPDREQQKYVNTTAFINACLQIPN